MDAAHTGRTSADPVHCSPRRCTPLLATGALWFLYHLRVRRLRIREATLERLVEARTGELARSKGETEAALATVEAQARELRSLDEAKSRFFANVSHELRTPLTLVQGPLQDVLDGRLGPTPDAVREQVATVLASGRRLGELVEQLLDVASLEAGELRLHLRKQDLRPLFERFAQSFRALARNRGIEFVANLPAGPVPATVDADRMEKVYANLLANAFKFTPGGGRVTYTVETVAEGDVAQLVVTVEDDGPGFRSRNSNGSSTASTRWTTRRSGRAAAPGSASRWSGKSPSCTADRSRCGPSRARAAGSRSVSRSMVPPTSHPRQPRLPQATNRLAASSPISRNAWP